jgi:lysozyme
MLVAWLGFLLTLNAGLGGPNMGEIETPRKYYDEGIPQTKQFEGFRDRVYTDTKGNPSIGYGFNLNDPNMRKMVPTDVIAGARALSKPEADKIFMARYNQAAREAFTYAGADNFMKLNPERQAILVDMAYNMGLPTLSTFKELRKALDSGDNQRAAAEMKNSDWYKQTGNRAKHHVLKFGGK